MWSVLRYTSPFPEDRPLERIVAPEAWERFLETETVPAVLVMAVADLEEALRHGGVRDRGRQHRNAAAKKTIELLRYFEDCRQHTAIRAAYESAPGLKKGVRSFLSHASELEPSRRHLFFLGTTAEIFRALRGDAVREDPDEAEMVFLRSDFLGTSQAAEIVRRRILEIARRGGGHPVLILGRTGTGKGKVAKLVHLHSRPCRPFVHVNCAAFPPDLLGSELFGHKRGSFTGATEDKVGMWAAARDGTLFLDEIGAMSLKHQSEILLVLDEQKVRRIGDEESTPVSARVIAATNLDLLAAVERGTFREDLYYRLIPYVIRTPALRDHPRDIELLARHFWSQMREKSEDLPPELPREILDGLMRLDLPGNARELRSILLNMSVSGKRAGYGLPDLLDAVENIRPSSARALEESLYPERAPRPPRRARGAGSSPARTWVRAEADRYASARPTYERLELLLRSVVERLVQGRAPLATVRSRTKSVARYAEKLLRSAAAGMERPQDIRDLCALRVLVHTPLEAGAVCEAIEEHFDVDRARSAGIVDPDAPRNFGYGPVRYIVRLDPDRAEILEAVLQVEVPRDLLGLWAEIEVRTLLEHAWATIRRDTRLEQAQFPKKFARDLTEIELHLRQIDQSFARIHSALKDYASSYPAYLDPDEARREIEVLEEVMASGVGDPPTAARLGKLAIILGDWDRAIAVLRSRAESGYPPLLRDLGVALCKKHEAEPGSEGFARGQRYLEEACRPPHRDPDAYASLAGTWKRRGNVPKANELYRQALLLDPGDPYALGGVLGTSLTLDPTRDLVTLFAPSIGKAIERSRDQAEAKVNLPWAYYDLSKFLILSGEPDEGLLALGHAVSYSSAGFMVETSLRAIEALLDAGQEQAGLELSRDFLILAWNVRFPCAEAVPLMTRLPPSDRKFSGAVVVVTAGNREEAEKRARRIGPVLRHELGGLPGTVLAMGVGPAVWSAIEEAAGKSTSRVAAFGYDGAGAMAPEPAGRCAFDEAAARGLLRAWTDVARSGIRPRDVRVLSLDDAGPEPLGAAWARALGARVVALSETGASPAD